MVFGFEVDDAQTFALQNVEPLFDLIQPRAMRWREVEDELVMIGSPLPGFFLMMRTNIVAHKMYGVVTFINLRVSYVSI
jgi:hypothetical protein